MAQATSERHPFLAGFAELERELRARDPDWWDRLRREATARFEAVDFPTTRIEEWKTTNVAPIAGGEFEPAPRGSEPLALETLPREARPQPGAPRLVFVDGRLDETRSSWEGLPDGVWVGGLARASTEIPDTIRPHLERRDPGQAPAFRALNGALSEDGAVVLVPDGVDLELPIQLCFVSRGKAGCASNPRNLIVAGRSSRLRVVETYVGIGDGGYLTNAVTETVIADNASVDHYRLQLEGPAGLHLADVHSVQGRDSRYTAHSIHLGGRLARNDVEAVLDGEGGWCRLNGLYLTRGRQHVDNHTVLDHAQPRCDSRELYKGVLDGRSRGVFNGRIIVRPGAQKTDAKQSNPNLLLSAEALANTRPQLEIYADDVKCTHGATIGRLDENAIFYLRSRGVARDEARRLLITAFAGEVLEQIELDPLREALEAAVAERLAGALADEGR